MKDQTLTFRTEENLVVFTLNCSPEEGSEIKRFSFKFEAWLILFYGCEPAAGADPAAVVAVLARALLTDRADGVFLFLVFRILKQKIFRFWAEIMFSETLTLHGDRN